LAQIWREGLSTAPINESAPTGAFLFLGRSAGRVQDAAGDIPLLTRRKKHAFCPLNGTN
jgi:hypothetical protein